MGTSHTQDLVAALVSPVLLVTLRILLLGWNCTQQRNQFPDEDDDDEIHLSKASKARNCATVCCGVSGMMMFTMLLMLVVIVYIFILLQSVSSPLEKDPSE